MELLFLPVLVGFIAGAYWIAWWMLEPINRVAGELALSTRFMLSDVLGLMALLQLPLAWVGRAIDTASAVERDNSPYWLLLTASCALALVLWGAAVSVVSRAGITRMMPRLAVIVLLVPATLAVIVAWPMAVIGFVGGLPLAEEDARLLVVSILGMGGLVVVMFGVRRLAFWSLGGSLGMPQSIALGGSHAKQGN